MLTMGSLHCCCHLCYCSNRNKHTWTHINIQIERERKGESERNPSCHCRYDHCIVVVVIVVRTSLSLCSLTVPVLSNDLDSISLYKHHHEKNQPVATCPVSLHPYPSPPINPGANPIIAAGVTGPQIADIH